MNNKLERLLIPEDFSSSASILTSLSKASLPASQTQCIKALDINNKDSNAKDGNNDSMHPLLNCLYPKSFSFYQCFSKQNGNCEASKNTSAKNEIAAKEAISNFSIIHTEYFGDSILKKSPVFNSIDSQSNCVSNCVANLLTPQNFSILKESKHKAIFPNVPEIFQEAHSADSNKVQTNHNRSDFISHCDKNDTSILKTDDLLNMDKKCHSDDEKYLKKYMLTPDNFANSSVRRKLNFDIPVSKASTITEKKYPEFHCSLNISENVYEDLFLANKEIKSSATASIQANTYPPIGVFWDIENCRVPKGLSATHVVQAIRNRFFDGFKEVEFICVCDTLKENSKVLEELNDAQVNIMHVGSIVKNAADDKLLQSMRRFADIHGAGATIVLISGDSDFATELYDLRYRKKLHVILVHNAHAQDSLKLSAHETALFSEVTQELPQRSVRSKMFALSKDIIVWNLPLYFDATLVKRRLYFLASNCGGKHVSVQGNHAKISFHTPELAARAKKRIDGEDVFGQKVNCTFGKSYDKDSRYRQSGSVSARELDRREDSLIKSQLIGFSSREELPMDIASFSKGLWNKSSGSSSSNNMDSCCKTWRMPSPSFMTNGHSFTSSPAFNSSQSSSRESSPSVYLQKNELQNAAYHSNSSVLPMSGSRTLSMYDNRSLERQRGQKFNHQWPDRTESYGAVHYQSDPSFGLNNLTLVDTSQIEDNEEEKEQKVTLVDRSFINDLWSKTRKLLWDEPKCSLKLTKFVELFTRKYNSPPDIKILKKDLQEYLQIQGDDDAEEIQLVPVQVFARDFLILLNEAGGRMLLMNFESSYLNRFEIACRPANLGFPNLTALLQSFGDFVSIKGKRSKRIIVLNRERIPDLPSYSPSVPPPKRIDNKEKWKDFTRVPPPLQPPFHKIAQPHSYVQNKISPPLPPPNPPCEQKLYNKDMSGSHLIMGLTSPPQTYQSHSPVIYSGSPAGPNGSVVWGQVWSPQYSVMPPLSPAHYMMPTIPINWGNMPSLPLPNQSNIDESDAHRGRAPVSIQTLEHFGKGVPPNPCELPSPEYLASNGDTAEALFTELEDETVPLGNSDERSPSTPSKNFAKKRLAAQFNTQE